MQFVFDDHVLDIPRRELRRGAASIAVEPQVFDLLVYLIRNRDRVVTKDDLIESVWGGRIVSDSTLASRLNAARKAVGDSGDQQRTIRTMARKGVRFVGDVRAATTVLDVPLRTPTSPPERPAIAVLPFVNMTGEPAQDYFSDGISEDLITALSRVRWFLVAARNASFAYKGKSVQLKQIAEELGVAYVVGGSVRRSGDHLRITAQLNDVATGNHLWGERYDRAVADVFAVQDEITSAIVTTIEPQLCAAESFRAQRKPPESLDAWDLVMRALTHFWRVTREDNAAAQALLEQAIAIAPRYAHAAGVLAVTHTFGAHIGWQAQAAALAAAEPVALAAVRADGEDAWAHLGLAGVHILRGHFEDALAALETSLRLNPNFALAQGRYGLVLAYVGRWQEGSAAARRALRLSPRDPFTAIFNGIAAYAELTGRNYDEAIRLARAAIRDRAEFVGAHRVLTVASAMAGDIEGARLALAALRRAQPTLSLAFMAENLPIRDPAEREHYLEGLRRAGLE